MGAYSAIRRAYALLKRVTPIPADCGRLCGKRCCKGGVEAGMILFPGEEELPASYMVTDRDMDGYPVRFAVCAGHCKRDNRPLSCRIFPFAPYLDDKGALAVIPDPRARYMCPLLSENALPMIDQRFIAAVESAFQGLLEADGVRPMLEAYSRMLDEYRRFTGYHL